MKGLREGARMDWTDCLTLPERARAGLPAGVARPDQPLPHLCGRPLMAQHLLGELGVGRRRRLDGERDVCRDRLVAARARPAQAAGERGHRADAGRGLDLAGGVLDRLEVRPPHRQRLGLLEPREVVGLGARAIEVAVRDRLLDALRGGEPHVHPALRFLDRRDQRARPLRRRGLRLGSAAGADRERQPDHARRS